jgi:hypothetical protein
MDRIASRKRMEDTIPTSFPAVTHWQYIVRDLHTGLLGMPLIQCPPNLIFAYNGMLCVQEELITVTLRSFSHDSDATDPALVVSTPRLAPLTNPGSTVDNTSGWK